MYHVQNGMELINHKLRKRYMGCLYKLWPDLITLGCFLTKMKAVLVCYLLTIMTAYRYRASHQFVFHKYQWRDNSMPNRTQLVYFADFKSSFDRFFRSRTISNCVSCSQIIQNWNACDVFTTMITFGHDRIKV